MLQYLCCVVNGYFGSTLSLPAILMLKKCIRIPHGGGVWSREKKTRKRIKEIIKMFAKIDT